MADPTLSDIMDMLEDIKDDIADVKQQCNDINPIKSKCDEIIATLALKEDISITCTRCKGTGKVMGSVNAPGGGLVEVDCPECAGKGWNIIGSINEAL